MLEGLLACAEKTQEDKIDMPTMQQNALFFVILVILILMEEVDKNIMDRTIGQVKIIQVRLLKCQQIFAWHGKLIGSALDIGTAQA